ncbi:ABC transporter family protein [Tritrichomonas foetus]|uniref:ABC transporter family protein n=1 Tax=Tritrichomonas foetus TaxID=1144522 RepID=A0A1J4J9V4_9EUKA|nr:ABC transporter family protein [Tritrichomonas foetus]|eukprot:OHS94221.1 ABC transporter family protein [Tritrichomonas foetus]
MSRSMSRRHSSEYSNDASMSNENKIKVDDQEKSHARWHMYNIILHDWLAIVGIFPSLLFGILPNLFIYLMTDILDGLTMFMASYGQFNPMPIVERQCKKMACVVAALGVVKFFDTMIWIRVGSKLTIKMKNDLFRNMMRSEVSFFDVNPIGSILTLLSEDSEAVQDAFGSKKSLQIQALGQGIAGLVFALVHSWQIALVSLCSLPIICVVLLCIFPQILKNSTLKFRNVSNSMTIAEETLSAVRTVKGFNHEDIEIERFMRATMQGSRHERNIGLYITLFLFCVLISVFADVLADFYYGATFVNKGKLQLGELFSVFTYTTLGSMDIVTIQGTMQGEQKAVAAGARILKLSEHIPDIPYEGGQILENFEGHIEFRNVSFKYPTRDAYVLKNVSFEIKPKQIAALVGHSGSGKSTCAQLLEKYYDATEGEVLLDGHDIRTLDQRWLHQRIALVSQEPVLFRMSVRENVKYGAKNATDEEVMSAIEIANAKRIIEKLEHGLDTLVGDKGGSLSGGQRQRIAIARAVIKNPTILITDEATSALDAQSEKKVQIALDQIMKHCTAVIVAHRLSTIRNAHIIYVFDAGEIKEVGNHDELVKLGGYYYTLVERQLTQHDHKEHDDNQKTLVSSSSTTEPKSTSGPRSNLDSNMSELSDSSSSSSS